MEENIGKYKKALAVINNQKEIDRIIEKVKKTSTIMPTKPLWMEHTLLPLLGAAIYHIVLKLIGVL